MAQPNDGAKAEKPVAEKRADKPPVAARLDRKPKMARPRDVVLSMIPQGAVGAEVGVFRGQFSRLLLTECKPKKLHLIDPWINQEGEDVQASWYGTKSTHVMGTLYERVQARFAHAIGKGRVELHRGFSGEVLRGFAAASLDFIYIDGDHRYEGVKDDLACAMRVVRPGGLIVADDYRTGGWWKDGVIRAVNEFLGAHPRAVQIAFMQGGQIVLRKIKVPETA